MARADLIIDQGTDFSSSIQLKADDGTNINIAGYIFTSSIRANYFSANVTANLIMVITDAANGNVTMSLDAANTANIPAQRYVYDIKMKNTSNVTSRLAEGMFTVTPQVTKA